MVNGLQASKSYTISVVNIDGKKVIAQSVTNQNTAKVNIIPTAKGVYLLRIYDQTKQRTIGSLKVLAQ